MHEQNQIRYQFEFAYLTYMLQLIITFFSDNFRFSLIRFKFISIYYHTQKQWKNKNYLT